MPLYPDIPMTPAEQHGRRAAEAIIIAARNYEDGPTFAIALDLATKDLSRAAMFYAIAGVGGTLSAALQDTVWRAEHSAACPNVEW